MYLEKFGKNPTGEKLELLTLLLLRMANIMMRGVIFIPRLQKFCKLPKIYMQKDFCQFIHQNLLWENIIGTSLW
jgi:hypothetical protein